LYANYNISFIPLQRASPDLFYGKSSQFSKGYDPKYRRKEFSFGALNRQVSRMDVLKEKLAKTKLKLQQIHQDSARRLKFAQQLSEDYGVCLPRAQVLTSSEEDLLHQVKGVVRQRKEHAAARLIQKSWEFSMQVKTSRRRARLEEAKAVVIQRWWAAKVVRTRQQCLKKARMDKARLMAVLLIQAYYRCYR
jgi:hypothetical protein